MRIATFNIYNSDYCLAERLTAVCAEIDRIKPDMIALQEVNVTLDENQKNVRLEYILAETGFHYSVCKPFVDCPNEGLAVLSKGPIIKAVANWEVFDCTNNCGALYTRIDVHGMAIGFVNVHLDYLSMVNREVQITKIVNWITSLGHTDDLLILCGDFNCDFDSSVHRYLTGKQSLNGSDTQWLDVIYHYEENTGVTTRPTLDFINNPWWKERKRTDFKKKACYDWIFLKRGKSNTSILIDTVEVFGMEKVSKYNIVPSDHYGIYVDLKLWK